MRDMMETNNLSMTKIWT